MRFTLGSRQRQFRLLAWPDTYKWIRTVCSEFTAQQKDDVPVLSKVSCWRYGMNKSCFGFIGLHSLWVFWSYNKSHHASKQSSPKNFLSFLSFCTIAEKWIYVFVIIRASLQHAFPTLPHSCPYSHTATERTVAFNSSPADLAAYQQTQDLLHNFKRHIATFHRLQRAGSKAALRPSDQICAVSSERDEAECNCGTHYQYIFVLESHTTREVTVWGKNQRICPLWISCTARIMLWFH